MRLGRLQIFNNWSPYLVADSQTIWLGLEYFCTEGDDLWSMRDPAFLDFAARELAKIGLIDTADVLDGTVVRKNAPRPPGSVVGVASEKDVLVLQTRDSIGELLAFLDELGVCGHSGLRILK